MNVLILDFDSITLTLLFFIIFDIISYQAHNTNTPQYV